MLDGTVGAKKRPFNLDEFYKKTSESNLKKELSGGSEVELTTAASSGTSLPKREAIISSEEIDSSDTENTKN